MKKKLIFLAATPMCVCVCVCVCQCASGVEVDYLEDAEAKLQREKRKSLMPSVGLR